MITDLTARVSYCKCSSTKMLRKSVLVKIFISAGMFLTNGGTGSFARGRKLILSSAVT